MLKMFKRKKIKSVLIKMVPISSDHPELCGVPFSLDWTGRGEREMRFLLLELPALAALASLGLGCPGHLPV